MLFPSFLLDNLDINKNNLEIKQIKLVLKIGNFLNYFFYICKPLKFILIYLKYINKYLILIVTQGTH